MGIALICRVSSLPNVICEEPIYQDLQEVQALRLLPRIKQPCGQMGDIFYRFVLYAWLL